MNQFPRTRKSMPLIRLRFLAPLSILALFSLGLLSCSSAVTIRAQRFSGIVLDTTMVIDVGTITGEGARKFRDELIDRIRSSDAFKLATESELPAEQSAVLLIEGKYWPSSSEEFRDMEREGQTEHYRLITYTVQFEYTITDMITGDFVVDGLIEEHRTESEKVEAEGFLESIVSSLSIGFWKAIFGIDEYRVLRENVARRFVAELSPRGLIVEVNLFKDSDMPDLETGIRYARVGRWKDALWIFLNVIDRYPTQRNIHKAYYNAGVAYEYDHQYYLARDFLEQAVSMSDDEEYLAELWRCRRYEQEYRWREGYLEKLRMRNAREKEGGNGE